MTLLLEMTDVQKAFGGVSALASGTLAILPGEVMGLIGQNGAGKSSMIKVLNGAYRRDSGRITFDGKDWKARSPQEAQRLGVSTIFQELNLIAFRTVTENIFLGREVKRFGGLLDWVEMNAQARQLLARFNVSIDVTEPLSQYSTAVQQMVAIARAVSFDAKLVIMDEPTSSLDEAEVDILMATVRQLKSEGVAVLFVTHKMDELYRICDRITIMRDGKTVAVVDPQTTDKLQLVATMLGRDLADVKNTGATAFTGTSDIGAQILSVKDIAMGTRLTSVDLAIRQGEIVGLAGLLGSGRTETARVIFAADRADHGTVSYAGEVQAFKSPLQAIGAGIGFCSEDRKVEGIIPDMSVADNLTLALMPALQRSGLLDEKAQRGVVEKFIHSLGIKCSGPDQKIRELSGGNQQKVLLARWLAMNPKLLILDEPTRGIDVGAKAEIQTLIRKLAMDGLGVLMISSELEEIVEGADRVFVLREGRTVRELDKNDITENAVMEAMANGAAGAGTAHAENRS